MRKPSGGAGVQLPSPCFNLFGACCCLHRPEGHLSACSEINISLLLRSPWGSGQPCRLLGGGGGKRDPEKWPPSPKIAAEQLLACHALLANIARALIH